VKHCFNKMQLLRLIQKKCSPSTKIPTPSDQKTKQVRYYDTEHNKYRTTEVPIHVKIIDTNVKNTIAQVAQSHLCPRSECLENLCNRHLFGESIWSDTSSIDTIDDIVSSYLRDEDIDDDTSEWSHW
jgi:hypothetical protein